ncbi:siderophore ABC transporter substrate-binding protein [Senegalia massiliensis]|uniref:siderophore ABC transporter substrate-binding protein n=1 Tax=Senegalia massiliensis TaxID=1720316 RepID=UPI001031D93F|nr:siderophore ABC transporter substrate-binding protein [Senegalia massiliensis]
MKISKKITFILFGLVLIFTLGACSQEGEVVEKDEENVDSKGYKVTLEDEYGKVELTEIPEKIVVFDYGILDAINEMGYGDNVIGLPKSSVPEYLSKFKGDNYTDVGTLKEPNFEKIFELDPDLIIISGRQASKYDEFKEISNTAYMAIDGANYMESFKGNMNKLGKIFDDEEKIDNSIKEIEEKIKELNTMAEESNKTGLYILANDGELSVYGPGSRFGILYDEFGIKPIDTDIESSSHGQKVSFEYILEKDPDILFVMDRSAIVGGDISAKQTLDNDIIKSTKAYKNENIVYLDSPIWYVASGGIEATNKMIEDVTQALK